MQQKITWMQLLTIGVLSSCFISSCQHYCSDCFYNESIEIYNYINDTDYPIIIEQHVLVNDSLNIRTYRLDSEATMEFKLEYEQSLNCTIDNIEQSYWGTNCLLMYSDSLKITFNDSTFYWLTRADTVDINILLRENYVITEQGDDQTDYKYTFTEKDYRYSTSHLE